MTRQGKLYTVRSDLIRFALLKITNMENVVYNWSTKGKTKRWRWNLPRNFLANCLKLNFYLEFNRCTIWNPQNPWKCRCSNVACSHMMDSTLNLFTSSASSMMLQSRVRLFMEFLTLGHKLARFYHQNEYPWMTVWQ